MVLGSLAMTAGVAPLTGKHRHGAENLVLGHFADFESIDKRFGMTLNDHEYVVRLIALTDQRFATGDALEAVECCETPAA